MTAEESDTPSGSPSEYILKMAWKRLWKKDTPYYLPRVIAEGITKKGHSVKPLSPLEVPDMGPMDLLNLDKLGTLSVGMNHNVLRGLDNIENGGISYDDTEQTFWAEIDSTGDLEFSGQYQIYTSSKVMGCALDAAHSLLSIGDADAAETDDDGKDRKSDLDVAREYRSKLVKSDNGRTLVGTYYDNNEAMSRMFESSAPPAQDWQKYWKLKKMGGKRASRELMKQTSSACRNPDDSNHEVGGVMFKHHSFRFKTKLYSKVLDMEDRVKHKYKDQEKNPFTRLKKDMQKFRHAVGPYAGNEQTAGSVMDTVQRDPEGVREEIEAGNYNMTFEEDEWEEDSLESSDVPDPPENDEDKGYKTQARGRFKDTLSFSSLKVEGTLDTSGSNPTVSLNHIYLTKPSLSINLRPPRSGDHSLYEKAVNAIANSEFVTDLIIHRIRDRMNSKKTRSYIEARINDSIKKIFG